MSYIRVNTQDFKKAYNKIIDYLQSLEAEMKKIDKKFYELENAFDTCDKDSYLQYWEECKSKGYVYQTLVDELENYANTLYKCQLRYQLAQNNVRQKIDKLST